MAVQWSEFEARAVLAAWRSSGLSIERFATARGLVPQRLRWWKKKLETGAGSGKSMSLLPVRVVAASEPSRGAPVQVILPSGLIVRGTRVRRRHVRARDGDSRRPFDAGAVAKCAHLLCDRAGRHTRDHWSNHSV